MVWALWGEESDLRSWCGHSEVRNQILDHGVAQLGEESDLRSWCGPCGVRNQILDHGVGIVGWGIGS